MGEYKPVATRGRSAVAVFGAAAIATTIALAPIGDQTAAAGDLVVDAPLIKVHDRYYKRRKHGYHHSHRGHGRHFHEYDDHAYYGKRRHYRKYKRDYYEDDYVYYEKKRRKKIRRRIARDVAIGLFGFFAGVAVADR